MICSLSPHSTNQHDSISSLGSYVKNYGLPLPAATRWVLQYLLERSKQPAFIILQVPNSKLVLQVPNSKLVQLTGWGFLPLPQFPSYAQPTLIGWCFYPRRGRLRTQGPIPPCPSLTIGQRFCAGRGKLRIPEATGPCGTLLLKGVYCLREGGHQLRISGSDILPQRVKIGHKNRGPQGSPQRK